MNNVALLLAIADFVGLVASTMSESLSHSHSHSHSRVGSSRFCLQAQECSYFSRPLNCKSFSPDAVGVESCALNRTGTVGSCIVQTKAAESGWQTNATLYYYDDSNQFTACDAMNGIYADAAHRVHCSSQVLSTFYRPYDICSDYLGWQAVFASYHCSQSSQFFGPSIDASVSAGVAMPGLCRDDASVFSNALGRCDVAWLNTSITFLWGSDVSQDLVEQECVSSLNGVWNSFAVVDEGMGSLIAASTIFAIFACLLCVGVCLHYRRRFRELVRLIDDDDDDGGDRETKA